MTTLGREKGTGSDKDRSIAKVADVPDLFIDKPFGYERTEKGYLLYSVGENMKYDGPKKEDDDGEDIDDIVVRVES